MNDMIPRESVEQVHLFQWARMNHSARPELDLLFHVPNGGSRNKFEGHNLKLQGVKSGVPDLILPVARGGFHGLYIELKRKTGGRTSESQQEWLRRLREQGYAAVVCHGWEQAADTICLYLDDREVEG